MANYCTVEQIKNAINLTTTANDAVILGVIERTSRMIDDYFCYPPNYFLPGSSPDDDELKYFDGTDGDMLWLDDLLVVLSEIKFVFTNETLASADYFSYPYNKFPIQAIKLNPDGAYSKWPNRERSISIFGLWGVTATLPPPIEQATIIQAVRIFREGQQAFQDGARTDVGKLVYVKGLHPNVVEILSNIPVYNQVI